MRYLMMLLFLCIPLYARASLLTLDLTHVELSEAIRIIAKTTGTNVVVDDNVQGTVNLHLRNESPEVALSTLLLSQGLAKWREGNVWVVGVQEDMVRRKQAFIKWQALEEAAAPLNMRVWQLHYASANDVAALIKSSRTTLLSKRGQVSFDARTNVLYVHDIGSALIKVQHLIQRVDVPVRQIAIEARLASVDSDSERELGVEFAQSNDDNQHESGAARANPKGKYSIAIAKLADGSQLDVKLLALERAGRAELISRPSLFTANQQTASIEAGEEVPYQEVSESGGTAIAFKRAVLGLKVTPKILPGNNVLMLLQINQDRPSNKFVLGMPTISTRQITTNVLAKNGQTIVLGGIYEVSAENGTEGLPFLSQIPVIGFLFRQKSERQTKRELLIFVTPTIVA